jgi:hypothetical protein
MDFAKVFLLVFVIHLAAGNVIRKKRSDTVIAGGKNKYILNKLLKNLLAVFGV